MKQNKGGIDGSSRPYNSQPCSSRPCISSAISSAADISDPVYMALTRNIDDDKQHADLNKLDLIRFSRLWKMESRNPFAAAEFNKAFRDARYFFAQAGYDPISAYVCAANAAAETFEFGEGSQEKRSIDAFVKDLRDFYDANAQAKIDMGSRETNAMMGHFRSGFYIVYASADAGHRC